MDEDIVIDSECFRDLRYIIKDKHIILKSNNNGTFAVSFKAFRELLKEVKDVYDVYSR